MNRKEDYIAFSSTRKKATYTDYLFIFSGKQLLIIKNTLNIQIPTLQMCEVLTENMENLLHVCNLEGKSYYCADLSKESILPEMLEWGNLSDERWIKDSNLYFTSIKAYQLLCWHKTSKYCGRCGALTYIKNDEIAKQCPNCNFVQYPRISPAIIVGIKKDEKILLAHNSNFQKNLYSIIAGFVEQGETLEQAVKREVYEEVGIKIKNISYFKSRPFSSEDSLMIGFVADYESGEIKVDNKEIVMADWYSKNCLPIILPSKLTLARAIIDYLLV